MIVMLLSCCVLVLLATDPGVTAPTFIPEERSTPSPEAQFDLKLATDYLHQYYDLQHDLLVRVKRSEPALISKVKEMQMFFGLNSTGELDSETLEVMQSPRCGVPDVEEYSHIQSTRWNKNVITYRIGRYTRDLRRSTVDSLIESAFGVWARASGLTFIRTQTRNADIMVEFVTYAHGDFYPFDGPRGTLAHAFGPGTGAGGDTHFDDDERWTAGRTGFNLLLVAAHEFGHALGLKHSRNPESLMYPTYRAIRPTNLLSSEDVTNIKALYSPFRGPRNWLLRPLLPRLMQEKCAQDLTFDAVTTVGDATFFFRDRYLWIKHNVQSDIKEGPITNFMPTIETRIDAAFWIPRRSTAYLIHESTFWTVKGSVVRGKPRSLSFFGFPAWVQDVDATVHIVKTGRTLFFMHDIYWSYNENRKVMDFGYPRTISEDFPGVNATINAAFYKGDFIYFFVGPQVYKFDYSHRVVVGIETANSWLGC
ncbi:matrix metalloproteinase-20 [Fundulus heteroclitus]|uniref:matrix metalloproteinase-20 n=1 Tax=Fundulus heteroclitus TaxID=8078 RepID=UPI00165CE099|nr:matrix metalloproteinase-20 [Fundulus heteroclitus]